jgi:hypothetical protein
MSMRIEMRGSPLLRMNSTRSSRESWLSERCTSRMLTTARVCISTVPPLAAPAASSCSTERMKLPELARSLLSISAWLLASDALSTYSASTFSTSSRFASLRASTCAAAMLPAKRVSCGSTTPSALMTSVQGAGAGVFNAAGDGTAAGGGTDGDAGAAAAGACAVTAAGALPRPGASTT